MTLSITTAEADELARRLAELTGESLTEAVTEALRERLARERARQRTRGDLSARLARLAERLRADYDTSPVTEEEWNAAGDNDEMTYEERRAAFAASLEASIEEGHRIGFVTLDEARADMSRAIAEAAARQP